MLIVVGDKNFCGRQFEADLEVLDATIHRPRRKDEPGRGPHLAPIRQRIESIFFTAKDILGLAPPRARPAPTARPPRLPLRRARRRHRTQPPPAPPPPPAAPPRSPLRRARRRHRTQPPPRPPQPLAGLLHRLSPRHNSSSVVSR